MTRPAPAPIVLFEDAAVADLGPIAHTRPAFELRVGALNLRERIALAFPRASVLARVRPHLEALLETVCPSAASLTGEVLLLNARAIGAVEDLQQALGQLQAGSALRAGSRGREAGRGAWLAACVDANSIEDLVEGRDLGLRELPAQSSVTLLERPWELVEHNDAMLVRDHATLARLGGPHRRLFGVHFTQQGARRAALLTERGFEPVRPEAFEGAFFIEPDRVLIASEAKVRPGAVIDAAKGPVILGAGVVVHPLSVVVGPAYLGPGTVVNPGAKLREGTSIGAWCKVGGEIEETIMLDLSNKQHDGFLGHALVGSWVNLGADTNGSDLKNNYGNVRVDLGDGAIDSGSAFVGQHLADHVKTGIDTMLTTGAVVGVAANVFGGGFAPRFVPPFTWGGSDGFVSYRLEAAIDTARTVFGRRDAGWDARHEDLLRHVHAATAGQRGSLGLD